MGLVRVVVMRVGGGWEECKGRKAEGYAYKKRSEAQ
jgi:hypothetical protein